MQEILKRIFTYGPALIVLAAILWGIDGILRRSLFTLPPITIVFFEHLIGALILAPFFFRVWKHEKLAKKEWGAIILVSILSGVLGTLWFTTALQKVNFIPFSVVFLLQKLQPIFTIGVAALVLKETVNRRYIGWAALAIFSAYFVTFPGGAVNLATGSGTIIAALFAVGAAIAWGSSTAFSRFVLISHSHTFVTGMRFFITLPFALLLLFLLGQSASLSAPTGAQLGTLLIIALSTGMVALWIYYRGLKFTQAKIATILELAFPLTGVLIDVFLYHTVLAWTQYLAALMLLYAGYRVSRLNSENS